MPKDHVNGILRGYKVLYRRANRPNTNFSAISTNIATLKAELVNLGKFKEYEIRVLGVTVGDGAVSPLFQRTDQDGKLHVLLSLHFHPRNNNNNNNNDNNNNNNNNRLLKTHKTVVYAFYSKITIV